MSPLEFSEPALLVVAAAAFVGIAIAFAIDLARRRRAIARAGGVHFRRMVSSASSQRRAVKAVMVALGVALILGALARPQTEGESTWRRRGIDVAVVIDYSNSMLARDAYPDRLSAARTAADRLMAELEGDRVAAVAFAATAVHFPLTHDHRAARLMFEGLRPSDLPQGSGLARAIERARCIVRPDLLGDPACAGTGGRGGGGVTSSAPAPGGVPFDRLPTDATGIERARAMVVFTDGETLDRDVRTQVERAVAAGIQLYFVGVGTAGGELIPEYGPDGAETGWKKTAEGAFVTTRLDQAALAALATLAGGPERYVRLGEDAGTAELERLADELARLKKGDLDERVVRIPNEAFHWLLFPAFVLLLVEACASDRRPPPGRAA